MKHFLKFLYVYSVLAVIFSSCVFNSQDNTAEVIEDIENEKEIPSFSDWDIFIEAVIWQESRGVENAIGDNGKAVGVLQIHPIMVREANRILSLLGVTDAAFSYEDRYSREKSIEMFKTVQDYHNKEHDFDTALRIWNRNHPESYRTSILRKYEEIKSHE